MKSISHFEMENILDWQRTEMTNILLTQNDSTYFHHHIYYLPSVYRVCTNFFVLALGQFEFQVFAWTYTSRQPYNNTKMQNKTSVRLAKRPWTTITLLYCSMFIMLNFIKMKCEKKYFYCKIGFPFPWQRRNSFFFPRVFYGRMGTKYNRTKFELIIIHTTIWSNIETDILKFD